MTLASGGGGESDVPACGPPASFSVHLASSAVTPAGSVHKSRADNVVRMWVQLEAKTLCRYGCMYFLAALVLVCVDVIVMSSA